MRSLVPFLALFDREISKVAESRANSALIACLQRKKPKIQPDHYILVYYIHGKLLQIRRKSRISCHLRYHSIELLQMLLKVVLTVHESFFSAQKPQNTVQKANSLRISAYQHKQGRPDSDGTSQSIIFCNPTFLLHHWIENFLLISKLD